METTNAIPKPNNETAKECVLTYKQYLDGGLTSDDFYYTLCLIALRGQFYNRFLGYVPSSILNLAKEKEDRTSNFYKRKREDRQIIEKLVWESEEVLKYLAEKNSRIHQNNSDKTFLTFMSSVFRKAGDEINMDKVEEKLKVFFKNKEVTNGHC